MAGDDSAAPEELHQFRLSVKRFRYVLEFFQPCYGAALKDRIGLLKGLQDALGEMNDCDVAAKLVRKKLPKSDENRAVLLQKLEERTNERIELFRSRWAEGFAGHQNRRRWTDYLARYAVAPKPEEPPESNPPPEN